MARSEPDFYSQVTGRITWIILVLGLSGSAVLAATKGVKFGFGFLIGSSISYVSFWRWQQVVNALSPGHKRPAWVFVLRILLLVFVAGLVIRFLKVDVAAAVSGLLVSAAAVIIEIIYELIHSRS